jgi:tetratricopeptide (TPR) repeat protein
VRARATEGVGLAQEALGEVDAALKTFRELENMDSAALSALGLYHQARLEKKKGETDKAKAHLLAGIKKITDSKLEQPYVDGVSRELLNSIDPSAVPPPNPQSLSKEQREQLEQLEQLEKLRKQAEAAQKAAEKAIPKDISSAQISDLMDQINKKVPQRTPPPAPSSSAP